MTFNLTSHRTHLSEWTSFNTHSYFFPEQKQGCTEGSTWALNADIGGQKIGFFWGEGKYAAQPKEGGSALLLSTLFFGIVTLD